MNISDEFKGRIYRTRISWLISANARLNKIIKEWQGSNVDVIYENGQSVIVIVFDSAEDCLAFTLKYGEKYV